jgi:hypothetical protein
VGLADTHQCTLSHDVSEEDDTESDSDDSVSNDSGECDSDKDCVVISENETVIAHEESGNPSGKRDTTTGTQTETSSKKPKTTMTASF